ncbi:signal peptidase I [Micrococcus sp. EYE_162]|uniref:signal peptidase I n=1 Tax=unclassified Micrococcus TaxID=2620948 RepID=UPI002002CFB3|nr:MULTISPECIES: signal peptidase I [unclassified Micrococcus]MCK6094345.1 signal peptidase I [Micrococcus sp. EYE_212]MCK6170526.1 signal peptidase I [Micrococcus sp. EYE_162]
MSHPEPRDPSRSRGSRASGSGAPAARDARSADAAGAAGWWPWVALTVVAGVVLAAVLRAVTGAVLLIPSASMEPSLLPGDRVRIDASAAGGAGLERGDVVVFDGGGSLAPYRSRGSLEAGLEDVAQWWGTAAREDVFVKRVAGLPGDTVQCCAADGRLTVNGTPLDEPYLGRAVTAAEPASERPWRFEVPAGRMVVLGDNRADSRDSRALLGAPGGGLIPLDSVLGTAEEVVWPLDRRGPVDGAAAPGEAAHG